ncbi:MAG: AAA family ATPase [Bacilli bacterium]|nr:AAA family ATPase [Mycoplasmatota bacterium]MDY4236590.1 AAA family ATPase [Bacilli bacterium]
MQENEYSIINRYGDNFTSKTYITNPAIGREEELKKLILVLLTPDKSAILTGKPGIGKTAIVEGLAYKIQKEEVPDALKGYEIVKIDTQALVGTVKDTGDTRVQALIDEIKTKEKFILFVDEIHTLINSNSDNALDFANMFKTGLGRGDIKVIGATTSNEYERYILKDKAFVRRFTKIEVEEPDREMTIKILMGTLPKIEKNMNAKLAYTSFIQEKIMAFIVDITKEFNRVYETEGRYPDIALTLLTQAFSEAVFDNKQIVTIEHIEKAIKNSTAIYPDVINKGIVSLREEFKDLFKQEEDLRKDFLRNE